eukprot:TRINITY_DN10_c1_g1_i1.p1 TRINITY_DN10_c1_g1~~TRINITY_DN10_c1_g1_i1.p1  ORF type:complete len:296 (-),score=50.65 TRINITY_DN10_c1_g1_i1:42-929(-)
MTEQKQKHQQVTSLLGTLGLLIGVYGFVSAIYHLFSPYIATNPLLYVVLGMITIHHIPFWGFNLLLYIPLDLLNKPRSLLKYKTQPKTIVTTKEYIECAKVVLFNQHFVNLPLMIALYPMNEICGVAITGPVIGVWDLFLGMVICLLVEEVLFYYSHYLFHHRSIYKYIHKQHHKFTAPIGIAAEYAHPIESLVSNTFPVLAGPLVAGWLLGGTHITLTWFWMTLALINTVNSHSGYRFPVTPLGDSRIHDFHHSTFRDNYGALGLLDWLHGTDAKWVAHRNELDAADAAKQKAM